MYRGKKTLAVVTARGGSKTVPGKNLRKLGGRPLVEWAASAALASKLMDRVILTSDSPEIIQAAKAIGLEAPFVRPSALATDDAKTIDVIRHALENVGEDFDYVALVQPTSPFVTADDFDQCLTLCCDRDATSCASVTAAHKHPLWMYEINDAGRLVPILTSEGPRPHRRQELPPAYALNGAVFVARSEWMKSGHDWIAQDTAGYLMPDDRSIDIDTELDFALAEAVMARQSP